MQILEYYICGILRVSLFKIKYLSLLYHPQQPCSSQSAPCSRSWPPVEQTATAIEQASPRAQLSVAYDTRSVCLAGCRGASNAASMQYAHENGLASSNVGLKDGRSIQGMHEFVYTRATGHSLHAVLHTYVCVEFHS